MASSVSLIFFAVAQLPLSITISFQVFSIPSLPAPFIGHQKIAFRFFRLCQNRRIKFAHLRGMWPYSDLFFNDTNLSKRKEAMRLFPMTHLQKRQKQIKQLNRKIVFSCYDMSVIIHPEFSLHILQNWITFTIDNSAIFSKKKIDAIK